MPRPVIDRQVTHSWTCFDVFHLSPRPQEKVELCENDHSSVCPNLAFHYELATDSVTDRVSGHPDAPDTVTLYIKQELKRTGTSLNVGDTGKEPASGWCSKRTATIVCAICVGDRHASSAIAPFLADYGRAWTAVTIENRRAVIRTGHRIFRIHAQAPSLETFLNRYLTACPGEPDIRTADGRRLNPVHTIAIYGGNADLLIDTSLFVLKNNAEAVNSGIEVLRKATGIEDIVIVVPEESVQNYSGHLDARIQSISSAYPYAQPLMVVYHLTGRLPDEKAWHPWVFILSAQKR
jgi:electron transport complex protein RnfC